MNQPALGLDDRGRPALGRFPLAHFNSASMPDSLPRHSADRDHQLRWLIATGGGLFFIGATQDHKFRAFDSRTGKVLWETQLETGAYATPCNL